VRGVCLLEGAVGLCVFSVSIFIFDGLLVFVCDGFVLVMFSLNACCLTCCCCL